MLDFSDKLSAREKQEKNLARQRKVLSARETNGIS